MLVAGRDHPGLAHSFLFVSVQSSRRRQHNPKVKDFLCPSMDKNEKKGCMASMKIQFYPPFGLKRVLGWGPPGSLPRTYVGLVIVVGPAITPHSTAVPRLLPPSSATGPFWVHWWPVAFNPLPVSPGFFLFFFTCPLWGHHHIILLVWAPLTYHVNATSSRRKGCYKEDEEESVMSPYREFFVKKKKKGRLWRGGIAEGRGGLRMKLLYKSLSSRILKIAHVALA